MGLYSRPILAMYLVPLKLVIHRSSFLGSHEGQYISKLFWRLVFQSRVNLVSLRSGVDPSGAAGAVQSSCTVWHHVCSGRRTKAKIRERHASMAVWVPLLRVYCGDVKDHAAKLFFSIKDRPLFKGAYLVITRLKAKFAA